MNVLKTNPMRPCQGFILSAICALLGGCLAYNTCSEENGEYIGATALDLDLRESIIRKGEAPVGNLIADAFLDQSRALLGCPPLPEDLGENVDLEEIGSTGRNCPVIALQNAGGIRQETTCGLRDNIPEGPLYKKDIEDMLPFVNELWVVRLKGKDIRLILEHSVESLGIIGIASEAGHFLQVSGLNFQVDCDASPHVLSADQKQISSEGERVGNILVGRGAAVVNLEDDTEYEVVTNQFIAAGNDGFLGFLQRDEQNKVLTDGDGAVISKAVQAQDAVGLDGKNTSDQEAVIQWIQDQYDSGQTVGRTTNGRITLADSCK